MRGFKYTIIGFLLFSLTVGFNVSIGIIVYTQIEEKSKLAIALIILLVILLSAGVCTILDVYRRKLMIDKPLKEILNATEKMAKGNFSINLAPSHSYSYYDEFDYLKENLNKMASELSKSEVLKNDFIANVSHELKTPLCVIQSYANALKNETLPKDMRIKYLNNLQDSCKKLNSLISNILKLNKLENQRLLPELTEFNLSELLVNQIVQFEELIEKKEIDLECDIEEDLHIKSEESYLELVFNNLISNAIKFTDNKGKIEISLKNIGDKYVIVFKDNGCGMDSDTGSHIFDKFYQGDTSHSKEGNGLGLALVKKVIDIIGGSINVESEIGVGSTFTITIKGE